jgi:hypothetical protein
LFGNEVSDSARSASEHRRITGSMVVIPDTDRTLAVISAQILAAIHSHHSAVLELLRRACRPSNRPSQHTHVPSHHPRCRQIRPGRSRGRSHSRRPSAQRNPDDGMGHPLHPSTVHWPISVSLGDLTDADLVSFSRPRSDSSRSTLFPHRLLRQCRGCYRRYPHYQSSHIIRLPPESSPPSPPL